MANLVRKSGFQRDDLRPHAAGTLARLACTRAREAGIDVAPLMAKADVTSRQVEDDDVRLPVQGQIKFVELIAEALKDDFLAERYTTIVNEGISLHVREGKEIGVTFTYLGVERMSDRHQIEFWATSVVRACRQLTNRHLRPNCVRFLHRRSGGCPELSKFMGCDVVFGASVDAITFPGTIKQLPVVNADPYVNKLLVKYCEEIRSNQKSGRGTFRIGVENAIAPLLPHGRAQADEIAHRLGLSRRTLARRLASEGLTFEGVLSGLRADLAKRYLRDETVAISQIAWLVGYKEVSAFTHAFTRWTGKTPSAARAQEKLGLTEVRSG